jgi:AcrR family transcriptional regulator
MTEPRRGRPRSVAVHDAILDATRALLVEHGYAHVSMDRVASAAGVGKQTLYRRWPSKASLVTEAVMEGYQRGGTFELPDTGDLRADLRAWLHLHAGALATPQNTALVRALAAAAADNPDGSDVLYRQLTGPQQDAVMQRLELAADTDEIRRDADLEAISDALIGTILYRVLARGATPAETRRRFDGLVDALFGGVRPI